MKKKFLKLFTSVAMLALVFCLHQNVRAEDIAQPTEKDVYIHHDDGEDYVANRYERAIVVDRVVYQYLSVFPASTFKEYIFVSTLYPAGADNSLI